jgi:hypothetical protein
MREGEASSVATFLRKRWQNSVDYADVFNCGLRTPSV